MEVKGVTAAGTNIYCAFDQLVPIGEVKPNPENPNTHPDEQVEMLANIIAGQGWRTPITVSNRSGLIVRGHARLLAAKYNGETDVPVDYQNYESQASEYADLIADNRIAELADMDNTMLKDMIENYIDTGELDLEMTGFKTEHLEALMTQFHEPGAEFFEEDPNSGDNQPKVITCPECGHVFEQ